MLKIKKDIIDQIIQIAHAAIPNEACGYLAGKDGVITQCYRLTNMDQSPEHFSFDPKEQFEILKDSRSKGLELIANFHSHPETPARPSQEDIKLAFDPNIYYGIISLAESREVLKFFRIKHGEIYHINFHII